VYDFESNEPILRLPFGVSTLSADGALVLSGINPMRLVEVDSGDVLREYPGSYSRAHFSDSGRYVMAASFDDGATRVFDTFGGQLLYELRGTTGRVLTGQMTADEQSVATFASDGTVRVWDVGSQLVGTASSAVYGATDDGIVPSASILVATEHIFVPIGRKGLRETSIYNRIGGEPVRTLPGLVVAVSPDESKVVMQSWPGAAEMPGPDGQEETFYEVAGFKVVGIGSGDVIRDLDGPCVWYNSVEAPRIGPGCDDYPQPWAEWARNGTFSPDGALFALGGYSGYVVVWDVDTGEIVAFIDSLLGGSQTLSSADGWALVQFSPLGDHLSVHQFEQSSDTWILQRVNTVTWEVEAEISDLDQPLIEMAYTPDSARLAVVDAAANLVLVDVDLWEVTAVLAGQQGGGLRDIDISPNGRLAVTADQTGEAWVWDLETKSVVRRLEFPSAGSAGGLFNVEFVDDQTVLVSGESAAVLMTLDAQALLQRAKDRVTRTFTEQECATYTIEPCPTSRESNS
jgi:WD40 repeat protein